jgi:hypothetical protein
MREVFGADAVFIPVVEYWPLSEPRRDDAGEPYGASRLLAGLLAPSLRSSIARCFSRSVSYPHQYRK